MAISMECRLFHNKLKTLLQFNQKRSRVKPKWASSNPKLSPSELALGYFDSTYSMQLGEQWPSVRVGLLSERKYGALVNNFSCEDTIPYLEQLGCQDFISSGAAQGLAKSTIQTKLKCFVFPKGDITRFKPARPCSYGFLRYYLMDAASVLPVLALNVKGGDSVLDLCAGPGGKTLALLQAQTPRFLCANEWVSSRASRLKRTLNACLPKDMLTEEKLIFTSFDGRKMQNIEENNFDKVLVDVPCTSDKHSLMEENNLFSRSRMKERQGLPLSQTQLLLTALQLVRKGGQVVYSTCTLSNLQNQCVVEQAIRSAQEELGIAVEIADLQPFTMLYKDTFYFAKGIHPGVLVLPHLTANFGPIYFCKLQRLS